VLKGISCKAKKTSVVADWFENKPPCKPNKRKGYSSGNYL